MKFKATLIAFLFSINLLSEDQLYVVDLILIKYLPEFETNEIFTKPIVNFPDNMTFLRDFPYPELEINSVPFDLDYQFKDLFKNQNLLHKFKILSKICIFPSPRYYASLFKN